MYKIPKMQQSKIKSVEVFEGEPLEWKIKRMLTNNEPIGDSAPILYTERAQGVLPDYNIRTDRWEHAATAMDYITRSKIAKRMNNAPTDSEGANIKPPSAGEGGESGA